MSERWQKILSRFPAHMEATRPGKEFQNVAEALAQDLDILSAALARVRRAHRLGDADEGRDLFLLGGLHRIQAGEVAVLTARLALTQSLLATAGASDDAAQALGNLWGVATPGFRLDRYAIDQPLDATKTRARFIDYARKASETKTLIAMLRRRIGVIARIHVHGNGTIDALAIGAANALDCDVTAITHSKDHYLHRATVRDRMSLFYPVSQNNTVTDTAFEPADEELLIEENPLERLETGADQRKHGDLFPVIRRGFERTLLRITITGTGDRTIGPMLVNRDEGQGVGFAGTVANGSTLVFNEEGRALLDDLDSTSLSYGWKGACFAEGSQPHKKDFVFAGSGAPTERTARFAEATPPGALGVMFSFPHAGDSVPPLGIDVGTTRLAFFVQEGFFSYRSPDQTLHRVEPRPAVAFVNGSVFAPGQGLARQTAALVSLSWLERTAFRACIWIPARFKLLTPDDDQGLATRKQVLEAVERFRPAGVRLDADFIDNRWVLGHGIVFGAEVEPDAQGPGTGMELWSAS